MQIRGVPRSAGQVSSPSLHRSEHRFRVFHVGRREETVCERRISRSISKLEASSRITTRISRYGGICRCDPRPNCRLETALHSHPRCVSRLANRRDQSIGIRGMLVELNEHLRCALRYGAGPTPGEDESSDRLTSSSTYVSSHPRP
jgi:hypothetical protein